VKTAGPRAGFRARPTPPSHGKLLPEYHLVEEEECGECLVLRGRRNAPLGGQVREEGGYLGCSHLLRVADAVEEDVAPDPVDVSLLGAVAVMAHAQQLAYLVEQLGHCGFEPPAKG
jgi:hypothetical protein